MHSNERHECYTVTPRRYDHHDAHMRGWRGNRPESPLKHADAMSMVALYDGWFIIWVCAHLVALCIALAGGVMSLRDQMNSVKVVCPEKPVKRQD